MYFERNPVEFFVKARFSKRGPVFRNGHATMRFWSGISKDKSASSPKAPRLKVIRGLRQGSVIEFDPKWFQVENQGPIKGDSDGASRVSVTFAGRELSDYLGDAERSKVRRDYAEEHAYAGARSLFDAFVRQERIQLYVAEYDPGTGAPLARALGGLFLDVRYGEPPPAKLPTSAAAAATPESGSSRKRRKAR